MLYQVGILKKQLNFRYWTELHYRYSYCERCCYLINNSKQKIQCVTAYFSKRAKDGIA